jgi:hypothetical protein
VYIKAGVTLGVYAGEILSEGSCDDTGYVSALDWPAEAPRESHLVVDALHAGNVSVLLALTSRDLTPFTVDAVRCACAFASLIYITAHTLLRITAAIRTRRCCVSCHMTRLTADHPPSYSRP